MCVYVCTGCPRILLTQERIYSLFHGHNIYTNHMSIKTREVKNSNTTNYSFLALLKKKLCIIEKLGRFQTEAEIGHILSVWKFLYLEKQHMKILFLKISTQLIHFIQCREHVVPLRMHRLCDIGKTAYWDPFESRSRIFIPSKYDGFWRNSEIWPNFQWLITFFQ